VALGINLLAQNPLILSQSEAEAAEDLVALACQQRHAEVEEEVDRRAEQLQI
jgi:hypothetical protein